MSGENDLANRKSNASGDIIEVGQEKVCAPKNHSK